MNKTEIPERFRYASKPVISPVKEENNTEENNTVDILIEPILSRRMLNAFEAGCAMKKEDENENER